MSIRHWLFSAVLLGTSASSLSLAVNAKDLTPNSADLQYSVNVPPMQISINQGGGGCVGVETWDPTAGKCTETEYIRTTAMVVSVTASPPSILADGAQTSTLTATVRDGKNRTVPAGIPVSWNTSLNSLSAVSSITNANGQTTVLTWGGTVGTSTVRSNAKVATDAHASVTFTSSGPVINSVAATRHNIYENSDSYPALISWSGEGLDLSTTYTIKVVDSMGRHTGPNVFTPPKGSTSFYLCTRLEGRNRCQNNNTVVPYSDVSTVTVTACNGASCSSGSTTMYSRYDTTGSN